MMTIMLISIITMMMIIIMMMTMISIIMMMMMIIMTMTRGGEKCWGGPFIPPAARGLHLVPYFVGTIPRMWPRSVCSECGAGRRIRG